VSGRSSRRPIAGTTVRRTRAVKRASAGISPIRAGAALAMLLSAAAIYGVGASSAFDLAHVRVDGERYTEAGAVDTTLAGVRGQNVFRLALAPLVEELRTIPTVLDVRMGIVLPDTLAVTLTEREPIVVWAAGGRRYLVDADGKLFGRLEQPAPPEAADLPVVEDRRAASAGLSVGLELDPVDLDAATRLASLVPGDVGSEAQRLVVQVTDEHGFVIRARPGGWMAVFGFYTPSLRTTDIIPGQVRLLRSLVIGREARIDRVILADETDGTYTERPLPTPSASPEP
jgi:cell division septal protein FtsQ